jgi:glutathione S-transferase
MRDNPLGKIPTLVLEDDRVLFDSAVICEYLDGRYGTGNLFPQDSGRALARAGSSRCVRILTVTTGSSIAAMILSWPEHAQRSMSMSNTRLSSRARLIRAAWPCACLCSISRGEVLGAS